MKDKSYYTNTLLYLCLINAIINILISVMISLFPILNLQIFLFLTAHGGTVLYEYQVRGVLVLKGGVLWHVYVTSFNRREQRRRTTTGYNKK